MEKIALFFGPVDGSVHRVAKMIAAEFGVDKIDLIPVQDANANDLEKYDRIIFGISTVGKETWEQDFTNTDWANFFRIIKAFDFSAKRVATYGLGDHLTYAYHFVDSMGQLAKHLVAQGATLVGKVSPEGYTFQDSEALEAGMFLGLPIDEDYEADKTPGRLKCWVDQLRNEL